MIRSLDSRPRRLTLLIAGVLALAVAVALLVRGESSSARGVNWEAPPGNAKFDYQIGGDYKLPRGVRVVSRDWFSGEAAADPVYSVCYVNGFQTQANEPGTDRPDELSNWPRDLVLKKLGDDPKWGGEYLVDIRSAAKREAAAEWLRPMIEGCADDAGSGSFEGVEFDNLDSWTRFNGTPLAKKVPFGKREALDFAKRLTAIAHENGLASAQKNTSDVSRAQSEQVGFDFAVSEECGRYRECNAYQKVYGDEVVAIEYRRKDFRKACRAAGKDIAITLRDRNVSRPGGRKYVYDAC